MKYRYWRCIQNVSILNGICWSFVAALHHASDQSFVNRSTTTSEKMRPHTKNNLSHPCDNYNHNMLTANFFRDIHFFYVCVCLHCVQNACEMFFEHNVRTKATAACQIQEKSKWIQIWLSSDKTMFDVRGMYDGKQMSFKIQIHSINGKMRYFYWQRPNEKKMYKLTFQAVDWPLHIRTLLRKPLTHKLVVK